MKLSIFIALNDAELASELRSLLQKTGFSLHRAGMEVLVARGPEGTTVAIPQHKMRGLLNGIASVEEIAAEVTRLVRSQESPANSGCGALIGESCQMRVARREILDCARAESNVLITGETGTGKELVAQLVHSNSARRDHPMVAINCAAIPDTLVESELFGYERGAFTGATVATQGKLKQADGSTLFLDEIGDLSPFAQAKILRALETRELQPLGSKRTVKTDIRVIAATNRDLETGQSPRASVENGHLQTFRADLFFRLSVIQITLPPLRDRMEDVLPLAETFLEEFRVKFSCPVCDITPGMKSLLLRHSWPGNVRELRNVMEAAFVNHPSSGGDLLELPPRLVRRFEDLAAVSTANRSSAEAEHVLTALQCTNWNKAEAARLLHWSRMTLYRKMAKYELVKGSPPLLRPGRAGV